jgi:hypothetical protein
MSAIRHEARRGRLDDLLPNQASRICAARLMSALTPAATQIGWLRAFLACYHDTAVAQRYDSHGIRSGSRRGSAGAAGDRVERLAIVRHIAGRERVRQRHRCFGALVVDPAAPAGGRLPMIWVLDASSDPWL